jgi:uncharacterized Rmd1/YagE family protein
VQTLASLTLPYAPTAGQEERLTIRGAYFKGQLDTKEFRTRQQHYPVLAADPLVLEPVRGSFVVMTKFGSLVFWNCKGELEAEILKAARALPGASPGSEKLEDQIEVVIGVAENRVTFDEVAVRRLTLDNLKIISLALAQSLALDRVETEVVEALRTFEPVVSQLSRAGLLLLHEKEVLRAVGFVLEVRQEVLANLTLFDKPPETWESEVLDRLDTQLYDFFDLEERLSAINQKMIYFSEMNSTLLNLLNHRKSVRLEWIIIILILIEVLFFVFVELRR